MKCKKCGANITLYEVEELGGGYAVTVQAIKEQLKEVIKMQEAGITGGG